PALAGDSAAEGFDDDWEPADPIPAYSTAFQGSFTGVGARFSVARGGTRGSAVDVGARISFPFYLGDLRAAYHTQSLHPEGATGRTHGGHLSLAVHPLFLLMLGSDWLGYTLASVYVDAGAGAHVGRVLPTAQARWRGRGATLHAGFGVDIPLLDPDRGHAPWLHLSWRAQRGRLRGPGDEEFSLHARSLHFGIAWRFNRLPF
ncbi:MAG: hypothetical protein AAGI01_10550, partial [Myxococcota bacterium]